LLDWYAGIVFQLRRISPTQCSWFQPNCKDTERRFGIGKAMFQLVYTICRRFRLVDSFAPGPYV